MMPFSQATMNSFTDERFDEINRLVFNNAFKSQLDFIKFCGGGVF